MGWSIGYDSTWERDVGYGVPAECDHPNCNEQVDRGLSHVCGGEMFGGDSGCGLYFCGNHLIGITSPQCARCCGSIEPFTPKPEVRAWVEWKLTDDSWQQWRDENPEEVAKLRKVASHDK